MGLKCNLAVFFNHQKELEADDHEADHDVISLDAQQKQQSLFLSLGFHLHIRFISSSFPLAFTPSSQVVFFLYFLFFPLLLGYDFMVQAGQ